MSGEAKITVEVERVSVPNEIAEVAFSSDTARPPPREAISRREWRFTVTATNLAGPMPRSITATSQAEDADVALGLALHHASRFVLAKGA